MAVGVGTRIGSYEIVGALGAGGMGEVYRARDTRLDRDVAIKLLPELFATDSDRLARFEREAKTLAALNHPNIASIYGIEEGPAVAFAPSGGNPSNDPNDVNARMVRTPELALVVNHPACEILAPGGRTQSDFAGVEGPVLGRRSVDEEQRDDTHHQGTSLDQARTREKVTKGCPASSAATGLGRCAPRGSARFR
jgi:hypothetical protein